MAWDLLPPGIAAVILIGIAAAFACRRCWRRRDYDHTRTEEGRQP